MSSMYTGPNNQRRYAFIVSMAVGQSTKSKTFVFVKAILVTWYTTFVVERLHLIKKIIFGNIDVDSGGKKIFREFIIELKVRTNDHINIGPETLCFELQLAKYFASISAPMIK